MKFLRWWFAASIAVALALPVIAIIVAAFAGISVTEALVPVAGIEFWWGFSLWLPVTGVSVLVCVLRWATSFLPWTTPET